MPSKTQLLYHSVIIMIFAFYLILSYSFCFGLQKCKGKAAYIYAHFTPSAASSLGAICARGEPFLYSDMIHTTRLQMQE